MGSVSIDWDSGGRKRAGTHAHMMPACSLINGESPTNASSLVCSRVLLLRAALHPQSTQSIDSTHPQTYIETRAID